MSITSEVECKQRSGSASAFGTDALEALDLETGAVGKGKPPGLAGCDSSAGEQLVCPVLTAQQIRPATSGRARMRWREFDEHVGLPIFFIEPGQELRLRAPGLRSRVGRGPLPRRGSADIDSRAARDEHIQCA